MLRQITLDDCVSAAEVVSSVARFVPRPDLEAPEAPTEYLAMIDFHLWQWKVREAYCAAEAGAQVSALLLNAQGDAPHWFAWDGTTGLPILDHRAKDDGHRILQSLTTYWKTLLEAQFDTPELQKLGEQRGDSRRLQHIGFVREEIVRFFDEIGIPHSLGTQVRSVVEEIMPGTPEKPLSRDRVGASDNLVNRKIEESIRAARSEIPQIQDLPKEDLAVMDVSWEIFKGWALDCGPEAKKLPPGKNRHYPIVGYDSRNAKVLFDKMVNTQPMNEQTFKKRIDPSRRTKKSSAAPS